MDAIDCIKTRRSIRFYENEKIPEDVVEDILDCGRLAPTAFNKQPWEFIVVKKKDALKEIPEIVDYSDFIKNCSLCIVICGNTEEKYYLEDSCAATENILLAAHAYGYGACWVAGHNQKHTKELKQLLKIPKDYDPVSIVSIGKPKEKVKCPKKKKLKDILHKETF